jgi:hypothetical protein
VDAGDDQIEAGQHCVRIVERTVPENVRFDSLEDMEVATVALVEAVDSPLLVGDLFFREATGIVR